MKKILIAIFLCLSLVPLTFAQDATPTMEGPATPNAPYSAWSGGFKVKASVPFVWPRRTPFAGGEVVGTWFPAQTLQALQPPSGSAQVYEAAFAQWWGYFTGNGLTGWVELALVDQITAASRPDNTNPANWIVNVEQTTEVEIVNTVPFAWIRNAAESNSGIARTLFPGARLILTGAAVSDGSQLWWPVQENTSGTEGFVEQNSLRYVRLVPLANAPVDSSTWAVATVVRIKAAVPFAWLRDNATSVSGITATVRPGRELIIANGPTNDGTQNWWQVIVPNTAFSGWVEENSLEKVR
jgi:hypothetical protein